MNFPDGTIDYGHIATDEGDAWTDLTSMTYQEIDRLLDHEPSGYFDEAPRATDMPQTGAWERPSLAARPSINDPGLNPLIGERSGTAPRDRPIALAPELYGSQGDAFQQTYGSNSSHMAFNHDQPPDPHVTTHTPLAPSRPSDPDQHHDHVFVKLSATSKGSSRRYCQYQLSCSRCDTTFGVESFWLEDCKKGNRKCKLAVDSALGLVLTLRPRSDPQAGRRLLHQLRRMPRDTIVP